ncbi:mucin-5AC-like [Alosa alosa]|uniref:mucin-5AC-like n=1 Tax=Alosa alosa TaxID=278164 RepID=UPI0020152025|nr:mucin-5AC-like [Alosa alosa]
MEMYFTDMDYNMSRASNFGVAVIFFVLILSATSTVNATDVSQTTMHVSSSTNDTLTTGVHTADVGPTLSLTTGDSTATSSSVTTYLISIKITNRIFNDTLRDPDSTDYKNLREEVESLFRSALNGTSVQYQRVTRMIFSNGSVIANSTTQFEASKINSNIVRMGLNNAKSSLLLQESFTEVTSPPATPTPTPADSRSSSPTAAQLLTTSPDFKATTAALSSTAMTTTSATASSTDVSSTNDADNITSSTKGPQHSPSTHQTNQGNSTGSLVSFSTSVLVQTNQPLMTKITASPTTSTVNATDVSRTTMHVSSSTNDTLTTGVHTADVGP